MKRKTIIFICTGNACRSQMAEGFAHFLLPKSWRVLSAGTIAAGVHPMAIEAMREIGIDISGQLSKSLAEIDLVEVDRAITLCGDAHSHCPVFPKAEAVEHWAVEDPIYASNRPDALDVFRRVRDDIRLRMEELADRLM